MAPARVRVALVTGATSGIGLATARLLAADGQRVILGCRDRDRGARAVAAVRGSAEHAEASFIELELASLDSVRNAAALVRDNHSVLDLLVCNAGGFWPEPERSADGLEMTMAVNHLGHFLLAMLLREPLARARGRVVVVTSDAYRVGDLRRAPLEQILHGSVAYRPLRAYADSKLANLLFALELGRRWAQDGVTSVALHPGMVATGFWSHGSDRASRLMRLLRPFARSPERAARRIREAAATRAATPGRAVYLHAGRIREPARVASDAALAAELWSLSERLVTGR